MLRVYRITRDRVTLSVCAVGWCGFCVCLCFWVGVVVVVFLCLIGVG